MIFFFLHLKQNNTFFSNDILHSIFVLDNDVLDFSLFDHESFVEIHQHCDHKAEKKDKIYKIYCYY